MGAARYIATLLLLVMQVSCDSPPAGIKKPSPKDSLNTDNQTNNASVDLQLFEASKKLLQTYCLQCHGQNQTSSGSLTNITDLAQKVAQGYISAGNPGDSKFYSRMTSTTSPMPPAGQAKPSKEELEKFKQWIVAGAKTNFSTSSTPPLLTEEKVLLDVAEDLVKNVSNELERKNYRYLSLVAAQNAGASADTLNTIKQASAKLLNSLSFNAKVLKPEVSSKNQNLIRINLNDLGWTTQTWDKIVKSYPYQIIPKDKRALSLLQTQMQTTLPVIRADWFVAMCSQPPLYYDLLEAPLTLDEFTKKIGIDLTKAEQDKNIMRAGFNNSEVADFSRVIERVENRSNVFMWHSFEFGSAFNDRNPFEKPFGPGATFSKIKETQNLAFNHDGKEIIYSLPNSFIAFFVVDGAGNRLDLAPTRARNSSAVTGLATVGVACMTCHSQGLLEKKDEIKAAFLKKTNLSKTVSDLVKTLYTDSEPFLNQIHQDTQDYQTALKEAGIDISQADPVSRILKTFNDSVNLKVAAGELGLPPEELKKTLNANPTVAGQVSALTTDGTISRVIFAINFQKIMEAVYGLNK
ncbi:hypothetical protein EBU99_13680 [bacterium]|nr:hypothetical protein [bacterium]